MSPLPALKQAFEAGVAAAASGSDRAVPTTFKSHDEYNAWLLGYDEPLPRKRRGCVTVEVEATEYNRLRRLDRYDANQRKDYADATATARALLEDVSPGIEPHDYLVGMITQLDNVIAGDRRMIELLQQKAKRLDSGFVAARRLLAAICPEAIPLDDLVGIISQLANLIAGYRAKLSLLQEQIDCDAQTIERNRETIEFLQKKAQWLTGFDAAVLEELGNRFAAQRKLNEALASNAAAPAAPERRPERFFPGEIILIKQHDRSQAYVARYERTYRCDVAPTDRTLHRCVTPNDDMLLVSTPDRAHVGVFVSDTEAISLGQTRFFALQVDGEVTDVIEITGGDRLYRVVFTTKNHEDAARAADALDKAWHSRQELQNGAGKAETAFDVVK